MSDLRVRMKVEGGDKIARKLQMMSEEMQRRHLREIALAAAEPIREQASANAADPSIKKTGMLSKNIYKEVDKQTKARVVVRVGPGKKGWYGRLVEDGHAIVRNKKVVGYANPKPFLRPAFDEKQKESEKVVIEELRRRFNL